jgi:hypothetical protein
VESLYKGPEQLESANEFRFSMALHEPECEGGGRDTRLADVGEALKASPTVYFGSAKPIHCILTMLEGVTRDRMISPVPYGSSCGYVCEQALL